MTSLRSKILLGITLIISSVILYVPQAHAALTDSLISFWKLDETSGTRVDAVTATGNDLTNNNSTGYGAGKINNGSDFSGSTYLSRANNSSLQTGDIDFTFAAWVKLDATGSSYNFISKDSAFGTRDYRVYFAGTAFKFAVTVGGTPTAVTSAVSPSTGTWYYVVAWHDATANTINIQLNNGTVDSLSIGSVSAASTNSFWIGAIDLGDGTPIQVMDGLIDEVGFWKRTLTSDERTSLYNSGAGLAYPFVTNTAPSASLSTPSQVSASSSVSFIATVTDSDLDVTSLTIEHSTNNSTWASSTLASVSVSTGTVATSTGSISSIDTNTGTTTLTITWNAGADLPSTDDSTVYLRIIPSDGTISGSTHTSFAFALDTAQPTAPGNLSVSSVSGTSATLTLPLTLSTDTNFSNYKIYYGTSTPVTTSLASWTSVNDSNLSSISFNSATSTTLTGLTHNLTYYFNLFAFDSFNNSTSSVSQVSTFTNSAPVSSLTTPSQVSASTTVSMTATLYDSDLDETSSTIEYSTDGTTWASTTLASASSDTGAVSLSGSVISLIDTDSGTTTLTIVWSAGTDLPNTEDSSVYLRITPNDGTVNGSTYTSSAFSFDSLAPSTPTGLTTQNLSITSLRVLWSETSGASSYNLYQSDSLDGTYTRLGSSPTVSSGSTTSYDATGLTLNQKYFFKISALDSFSNESSQSVANWMIVSPVGTSGGGGSSSGGGGLFVTPSPLTTTSPDQTSLLVQIESLKSQLSALQSQSLSASSVSQERYLFTTGFGPGSRGEQVRQLQIYLNTHGFPVSLSGLGSRGHETSFFGSATTKALMKFQESLGLTPVPWVGPATRTGMNR